MACRGSGVRVPSAPPNTQVRGHVGVLAVGVRHGHRPFVGHFGPVGALDEGVPAALAPTGMSVSYPKEDPTGTHVEYPPRRPEDARDRGMNGARCRVQTARTLASCSTANS